MLLNSECDRQGWYTPRLVVPVILFFFLCFNYALLKLLFCMCEGQEGDIFVFENFPIHNILRRVIFIVIIIPIPFLQLIKVCSTLCNESVE